ncbi:MAG: AlkZ family DNA glycosylase [Chloroflexi bacterium]|nr:AlkZ family DNA glycosylase [Chloroflexota bacterium]
MKSFNIANLRLHSQRLTTTIFKNPSDVVGWLGAVQSQDYAGAKWALGQRIKNATDEAIEEAFNAGAILRTHVMRPTWHFVKPEDIRWMLALTAPRVHALSATYYRKLELDNATFRRSNTVLIKALQGGIQLTRAELTSALKQNGIISDDLLRFTYLIIHAELDGVICSGARRGKQFTYALLDERAPHTLTLEQDAALAELAKRYFVSHGPATLNDFVWWSGLTVADARKGLDSIRSEFISEVEDRQTYWFTDFALPKVSTPMVLLLPNYDEYTVGYTDRSAIYDTQHNQKLDSRGNFLFNNVVVVNGQVVGTWKRTLKKSEVFIEFVLFRKLTKVENHAIADAAERYGKFLGLSVSLA